MDQINAVSVDLKEYKEFIIYQYRQGLYVSELALTIEQKQTELKAVEKEVELLYAKIFKLFDAVFKFDRMGSDTRAEQTEIINVNDGEVGQYFGFTHKVVKFLLSNGVSLDSMVKYINDQWDIKESAKAE